MAWRWNWPPHPEYWNVKAAATRGQHGARNRGMRTRCSPCGWIDVCRGGVLSMLSRPRRGGEEFTHQDVCWRCDISRPKPRLNCARAMQSEHQVLRQCGGILLKVPVHGVNTSLVFIERATKALSGHDDTTSDIVFAQTTAVQRASDASHGSSLTILERTLWSCMK